MIASGELTAGFEAQRPRLLAMARRILGSHAEAEDAVQEAWLRANRTDLATIANLPGWLTTTLARICLDMLRTRRARREDPIEPLEGEPRMVEAADLDDKLALAEAAADAMLVVFETLVPAERVAFIMHDVFDLGFDEIARILDRSIVATRQLASRARRRVRGAAAVPAAEFTAHRSIVDAYLAATRAGDLNAVLGLLDPDVELFADGPNQKQKQLARGARDVSHQALGYPQRAHASYPALIDGRLAIVSVKAGTVEGALVPEIRAGRINRITLVFDIQRLSRMDIAILAP